ncbi:MAG: FG-GAP repeat protein, partial [Proteobacteria bacterium]|nr:FG-GAP repeat protein [Pseudomonadota bacterium]
IGLLFFPDSSSSDDLRLINAPEQKSTLAPKDSREAPSLAYSIEHQHIAFSWRPVAGAHHYRLLAVSGSGAVLGPVAGAEDIRQNFFRLRIRHWIVDWADTHYQLQVCRTAKSPCVAAGMVSLKPKDAERATAGLWRPDLSPTPIFDYRPSLALSGDGFTMAWSGRIQHKNTYSKSHLTFPVFGFYSDVIFISRQSAGRWQSEATFRISEDFSDRSPKAIALSADGRTLAFGSSDFMTKDDFNLYGVTHSWVGSGGVYVYFRHDGQWSRQATVVPDYPGFRSDFGAALALSADGRTLAVGDPRKSIISDLGSSHPDYDKQTFLNHGAVSIYTRVDEVWQKEASLAAPEINTSDRFGISLALSADGHTLAVGAPYDDSIVHEGAVADPFSNDLTDSGTVCVYVRTATSWRLQACLKGADAEYGGLLGASVTLSADGNVLAAGAPRFSEGVLQHHRQWPDTPHKATDARQAGAVYLFARQGNTWRQTEKITAGAASLHDGFGEATALSADGQTLVVGAPEEDSGAGAHPHDQNSCPNAGGAYVYTLSNHKVVKQRRLASTHASRWNLFGADIAISGDANTVAVGAPGWTRPYYIFPRDGDPAQHEKLAQRQRPDLQWIVVY